MWPMAMEAPLYIKRHLTLDYKTFLTYLHLRQPFNYRKKSLSRRVGGTVIESNRRVSVNSRNLKDLLHM